MDRIEFDTSKSKVEDYRVVEIYINGQNLIDLVSRIEYPYAIAEGEPLLSGNYEGLAPLAVIPPSKHFLGHPHPLYKDKQGYTVLLVCGQTGLCDIWSFATKINVWDQEITWSSFYKAQRTGNRLWNYQALGIFKFNKIQYIDALHDLERNAYLDS